MAKSVQAIFLLSALFALSHTVNACSCSPILITDDEKLVQYEKDRSAAVFIGKVVRITKPGRSNLINVRFSVRKVWKGVAGNEVVVMTFANSRGCGYPFKRNIVYLVYGLAFSSNDLYTSDCTRTARLERAQVDLKFLGVGKSPDSKERAR